MLRTRKEFKEDQKSILQRTYEAKMLVGPYLDFTQIETEEQIIVTFDRAYCEDAKDADLTYFQLVVKALAELIKEKQGTPIYLNIWGKQLEIPCNLAETEIDKYVSDFILKNVSF